MARTRRSLLGAVGGAILVAGCVGDDDATEDGTDGDTPAPSDGTDGTESEDVSDGSDGEDGSDGGSGSSGGDGSENQDGDDGGAGDSGEDDGETDTVAVQVTEHETHGEILVGPDGLTLYMFDSDESGAAESTCYEGCAENWPPLTVEGEAVAGENVTGELTTFEREDGTIQVAVGGWPLYYFAGDADPGDAEGQAVNDVWWVLGPDGTPIRDGDGDSSDGTDDSAEDGGDSETIAVQVTEHETHGEILVGPDGLTLYMFDSDDQGAGESSCYDGCAENWPPLTVEGEAAAGEGVTGDLTTFEREDGTTQVAVGGWPLYYFASDESEGDTEGQGVNDVWWVLDPDGTPIRGEPDTGDGDGGGYPDLTADF